MKSTLKIQLQNTIKKTTEMLHAHYLVHSKDIEADAVKDFISVFKLLEYKVFGGALYAIHQKRNRSTRKPVNLPKEEMV